MVGLTPNLGPAERLPHMARSVRSLSRNRNNDGDHPPVALGGEVVQEAGLPHPWVAYPGHYGVFHTFADSSSGPWRLCSCAQPALATVAELHLADPTQNARSLASRMGLPAQHIPVDRPWAHLDDDNCWFQRACHRCNLVTPSLRWALPMYETQFNQFHGWYTQQAMARAGFVPHQSAHASTAAAELVELRRRAEPWHYNQAEAAAIITGGAASLSAEEYRARMEDPQVRARLSELNASDPEARKKWRRLFQDEARTEFGYRKVGEGFVAETQLASLVTEILGHDVLIERHHRPSWLEGLELDIWIPAHRLGIEYQGQQHYKAISAWGGESALVTLQERDRRKRAMCQDHGVALLEVTYTEALTRQHIVTRLAEHLPPDHLPPEIT